MGLRQMINRIFVNGNDENQRLRAEVEKQRTVVRKTISNGATQKLARAMLKTMAEEGRAAHDH